MRLHAISTVLIDAGARARVVWDCSPRARSCAADLRLSIAKLDRCRSFAFYVVCALISFCFSFGLCGCLGGQIVNPNASAGSLQASENNVSFGSVPLGTTTSTSVSVVNQGSASVTISQVSLAGQSFGVSGAGDVPLTVAAGRSLNLIVSFSPAAAGTATGQLTIASDAAANGSLVIGLSGSGTAAGAATPPALSSFSCVDAAVSGPASDSCTVTLSAAAGSNGFEVNLASNNAAVTLPAPIIISAGSTSVSFTAAVSAVSTTQTATLTASAGGQTESFALQVDATGQTSSGVPALIGLTCGSSAVTASGTDNCTVVLSAAAQNGGLTATLASSNPLVTVPSTVTVAAGATSASFAASIAAFNTAQTATLTASAGGATEQFSVQLNAAPNVLSTNTTSIAFGSVLVNTTATQSVELTASSSLPIVIAAATVQGAGFSITGATFPLTLAAGQEATIEVSFDPTAAGAATGQLSVVSTALASGTAVISLSGTGALQGVSLNWDAPNSSADPIVGYNVYRATSGSSSYIQLNSSVVTETSYVDATVGSGQTYDYIVESVDASGVTSSPSNEANVTLP